MAKTAPENSGWADLAKASGYRPGHLAKLRKMHPRQLRRVTEHEFGCSPRDLLHRLRLTAAEQSIRAGSRCKEVANQLNFADMASFCHWFKRQKGVSPSKFCRRVGI